MLNERPGCYFIIGNGTSDARTTGGCVVHSAGYDFNDAILPIAASHWVKPVRSFLRAN